MRTRRTESVPQDSKAGGTAFTEADFPIGAGLRVWEFGVGDIVRIRTGVSLRCVEPSVYEVYATCPFHLTVAGQALKVSTDQKTWQTVRTKVVGPNVECRIDEALLDAGKCRFLLRVR